jgi:hypothetical protein
MKPIFRGMALSLGAAVSLLAFAPGASACGNLLKPMSWSPEAGLSDNLHYAAAGRPTMVGMWSIKFQVGGHQVDFGYTQWHSDGTEFLNSGGRSPATQNYCMGVWKRTGDYTYRLNHFALTYDNSGAFTGRANIHEFVRLDSGGNSYDGTFTIDFSDANANPVGHVAGTIEGSRITP